MSEFLTDVEQADRDFDTVAAMLKHGGSFIQALGEAARRADRENLHKIKTTWPHYWATYEKMAIDLRAGHVRHVGER